MPGQAAQLELASAHAMEAGEVCVALGTNGARGLSGPEGRVRLSVAGANRLPEVIRPTRLATVARQLASPLIALLGIAAVVSLIAGEGVDAVVIAAIVTINAAIGYVQERKAESAALSLERLLAPMARVVRDGATSVIAAEDLVPGDVIVLRAGDRVPADGRLIRANDLEIDESTLTGESLPDPKRADPPLDAETPLADRATMAYAGTTVTRGQGRMALTATGPHTEVGRAVVAGEAAQPPATPLELRLTRFAAALLRVIALLCLALTGLSWAYGEELSEALRTGVALAVAAVPEGLPAVLTVALAVGMQRMAQRNAIVRRLPAVETLGSTTVICTDKTGTLTEGHMKLGRILALGEPQREVGRDALRRQELGVLEAAAIASQPEPGETSIPDPSTLAPTESAIVTAAAEFGGDDGARGGQGDRVVRVEPFDSNRKRMSVVVESADGSRTAYVKGAPEGLLPRLAGDDAIRTELGERAATWAAEGMRVLLVARRPVGPNDDPEAELAPLGLLGLLDPPRTEVVSAVAAAARAGVRTIVVTGDHPGTAEAIARATGIVADDSETVLTGRELDAIGDEELEHRALAVSIFARVAPEHKVRIVGALQRRGEVVAMTGDGVNDVPALQAAHIGVAMGRRGTDAAKEAADIVLTDDNYSTIVTAIRRGRSIYDNVLRFVQFLLAANAGEVLVFTLAIVTGLPAPLTVVQILLVNLLTDGPPAVALGVDPPRPEIMRRPPRPPGQPLLAPIGTELVLGGLFTGLAAFVAFLIGYGQDQETGQTMVFATLVAAQLAYVFAVRAEGWPPVAGRNRFLYLSVAGSAGLAAVLLAADPARELLDLASLDAGQLATIAILASLPFVTLTGLRAWRARS